MERKLAAILAADVLGYTKLMAEDEAGTLTALKNHRKELFDPETEKRGGRIVKLMGDGVLVEFPSVVNAVESAIAIQTALSLDDGPIKLRIGVNLGDIIIDRDDIYGDGVNVAARLEVFANPGEICISGTAYDTILGKIDCEFEDCGQHSLKNLANPVRIYRVQHGYTQNNLQPKLPEIPSIAVLPFNNMSGEPEQEFFSDGITEDIITDLSKVSGLTVISRHTVFTFKDQALVIEEVANRLNVGFVLEGSVRKSEGRVRITAQLIDGLTGNHIWAERYDRTLDDIFSLQDEISKSIVEVLKVQLLPEELKVISNRSTDNSEAYEVLLLGKYFFNRGIDAHNLNIALRCFAKAIQIDPNYARAYAAMAGCHAQLLYYGDPDSTPDLIFANSARALEIDPNLADAHAAHGWAKHIVGRQSEAVIEFERALSLDPNSLEAHYYYGRERISQGNFKKAVELLQRAISLNPDDYRLFLFLRMSYVSLGWKHEATYAARMGILRVEQELKSHPDNSAALCSGSVMLAELGETDRALSLANRAEIFAGDDVAIQYNLGCCYAKLGQLERAVSCLEHQLSGSPDYVAARLPWMQNDSDLDVLQDFPAYLVLLDRMKAKLATGTE